MDHTNGVPKSPMTQIHGTSLRKMKCLVCEKVVFPPVMQCKNWHFVCNICRQSLGKCPDAECQEHISSAIRGGVAEKFLEKYVIRCKYYKDDGSGCLEAFIKEDVHSTNSHEAICPLREVKCLVPSCYKSIRSSCLITHFECDHFIPRNETCVSQLDVSQIILQRKTIVNEAVGDNTFKSLPCYLKDAVTNDTFLAIFRMSSLRSPTFEISTVVHGYFSEQHKPSSKYRCRIHAFNVEDTDAEYIWEGPISQSYSLTPVLSIIDESAKLKWKVRIEIFLKS